MEFSFSADLALFIIGIIVSDGLTGQETKIVVWCNNWNKALLLLKNGATILSQQEVREEEVLWNDNNVEKIEEKVVEEVERIKRRNLKAKRRCWMK